MQNSLAPAKVQINYFYALLLPRSLINPLSLLCQDSFLCSIRWVTSILNEKNPSKISATQESDEGRIEPLIVLDAVEQENKLTGNWCHWLINQSINVSRQNYKVQNKINHNKNMPLLFMTSLFVQWKHPKHYWSDITTGILWGLQKNLNMIWWSIRIYLHN